MEEEGDGEDGILPVASDIPLLPQPAADLKPDPDPTPVPNHFEKEGALPLKKKKKVRCVDMVMTGQDPLFCKFYINTPPPFPKTGSATA